MAVRTIWIDFNDKKIIDEFCFTFFQQVHNGQLL